jgi:hypothetical protein
MKSKINLQKIHKTKVFKEFIYPVFAKDFLFGDDYELFAQLIGKKYILSPEQWECILIEWEFKESILSD